MSLQGGENTRTVDIITEIKALCESRAKGSGPYYILHVDDEELLHGLFLDLVGQFGFSLRAVSNGAEALEFIKAHPMDIALVISDVIMPGMNGFEFRQEVYKIAPALPVAILSSHVDREQALKGIELKIAAFLEKPVDMDTAVQVIARETIVRLKTLREEEELRQGFIAETRELIVQAEDLLLRLDQERSDRDALNQLFGVVHTIKGASSFFEPKTLHQFVHRFEDILKKLHRGDLNVNAASMSMLFKGIDQIKVLLEEFNIGRHTLTDVEAMIAALQLHEAREAAGAEGASVEKKKEWESEIKVSVQLLNEFMQMSGEMTVIRNMLNKCVKSIEKQYPGDRDVGSLAELLEELHKINASVQDKLTELRKIPLKHVLRSVPRAVRDVSSSLEKKLELKVVGDDLRVDTSIAEVLSNCLLHLIKNSIDHGIEKPSDRLKSGKPEVGTLRVCSSIHEEQVVVEVSDDGGGIDCERIKAKLVSNGSFTRESVNRMSEAELMQMIFSPGFSTAEKVTDVSGRGVGMSMVKTSVEGIGGRIEIESKLRAGTVFRLILPVPKSVDITNCLFVAVGEERLGIPETEVTRVLFVELESRNLQVREFDGGDAVLVDDVLIPVIDLRKTLGLGGPSDKLSRLPYEYYIIVESAESGKRAAIRVEQLLDVEDTVIKSIPTLSGTSLIYRGATFLNDGMVGLILSVDGLVDYANITATRRLSGTKTESLESGPVTQLIIFNHKEKGVYAVEQKGVFRIEQFNASRLQWTGAQCVVPYRGKALKLVNVDESPLLGSVTVLILTDEERFIGLVIQSVEDVAEVSEICKDLSDLAHGIIGHVFVNGQTVTVYDFRRWFDSDCVWREPELGLDKENFA